MKIHLVDINPNDRERFLRFMKGLGIEGVVKQKGTVGSFDRQLSLHADNLQYEIPKNLKINKCGRYSGLIPDPMILSVIEATSGSEAPASPVTKTKTKTKAEVKTAAAVKLAAALDSQRLRRANGYYEIDRLTASSYFTKDGRTTLRYIFLSDYNNYVTADDVVNHETLNEWCKKNTADFDDFSHTRIPVYLHGLLIEGIHFGEPNAELAAKFNDVTMPTSADEFKVVEEVTKRVRTSRYGRYKSVPASKITAIKPSAVNSPVEIIRHGYMTVGPFVITTFPDQITWMQAQPRKKIDDETLADKWKAKIVEDLTEQHTTLIKSVEKLQAKIIEENRRLGQMEMLVAGANDHTATKIKENIERLRSIPELESFTPTEYGFVVITKELRANYETMGKPVKERYCGKCEIQVDLEGRVRVRNIASPKADWRNPHGNCLGSFSRIFQSSVRQFDYHHLILAIMEYYRAVSNNYEWRKLPESETPPKTTYVSDWQAIVGEWSDKNNETFNNEIELMLQYDEHVSSKSITKSEEENDEDDGVDWEDPTEEADDEEEEDEEDEEDEPAQRPVVTSRAAA